MPTFDITAPDGTHYEVTGPEGATEEQALQQVMAQHQPSAGSQAGRVAGLTARNLIQGVTALPSLVANVPGAIYNAGANLVQGYHEPSRDPNAPFRFSSMGSNISDLLTQAGLPNPETTGERLGSDVAQGIAGAGGVLGLANRAGSAATPVVRSIAEKLAANPGKQLIGGGLGGGAAGAAREAGLPLPLQIGAGFAGGLVPFAAPPLAAMGGRIANRAVSAATAGETQLLNPATEAERRLREAFLSDGGPRAAVSRSASFVDSGASTPSLLDIGGASVRRLVRAAAGGGDEAHNIARGYADQVRGNLQDNATAAVNRMAPGNRTAGQVEDMLTQGQRDLADTTYAEPYSQPAVVNRQMVSALEGPEGRRVIRAALSDASANRDHAQMAELQDLLSVADEQAGGRDPLTGQIRSFPQALEGLSAGALDRVRIATRETARGLAAAGRNYRARGYFGRMGDIDTALDQTPGLLPARAAFRQTQQGIDAIPLGGQLLTMPADQYAAETARLAGVGGPPNIGTGLQAGAKQSLLDQIQRPAAGQTGVLNRLATSTGVGRNLSGTFGEDRAGTFRAAIRNEVDRLRNANFVSPESGSQTQLRGLDEGLVGGIPTSLHSFVSRVADKLLRGFSLTPAERAEIVRLGTSEADLRRFVNQAPQPVTARPTVSAILPVLPQRGNR